MIYLPSVIGVRVGMQGIEMYRLILVGVFRILPATFLPRVRLNSAMERPWQDHSSNGVHRSLLPVHKAFEACSGAILCCGEVPLVCRTLDLTHQHAVTR